MFLSVIIPFYNEKKIIKNTIYEINKFFLNKFEYEIIIIDDGSKFNINKIIGRHNIKNLKIIKNKENYGKGFSIKIGIKESVGEILLVSDVDLSTPINQYDILYREYLKGNSLVIGSRSISGSTIIKKQSYQRIIAGRVFNFCTKIISGINFQDTQCGFKLFNSKKIKSVIKYSISNRFTFDVEIILLFQKSNFSISEIGVVWEDDHNSSVRIIRDSIYMFLDLIKITLKHRNFKNNVKN